MNFETNKKIFNLNFMTMKKLLFYVVIAFAILSSSDMMAQQGFGTNTPDRSAAVDIVSTKRGFLMPRVALTSTTVNTPVANPHNALMVYNTNTAGDVTPGFYYWSVTGFDKDDTGTFHGAGKWVRMVDANDITTTKVTGLDGSVTVVETIDVDGNPSFDVSVTAGSTAEQVMVTIANPAFGSPGEPEFITQWVDYADFLADLFTAENGLTYDSVNKKLKLGGELTEITDFDLKDFDMNFNLDGEGDVVFTMTGNGELKLVGLDEIDIDTLDFTSGSGANEGDSVAIVKADGTVQKISLEDLIAETTYTANNGLTMTGNNVQLGGALTEGTTEIDINNKDLIFNVSNAAGGGSMQIKGLTDATAENTLVVRDADGVLHQVVRSASAATSANLVISSGTVTGYSPYVPEVNIAVTLAAADVDVELPVAAAAKGQVINIRITNTDDLHAGYCNIKLPGGTTDLTYGAMPYQGWIVKSDGTNWVVVGRN